MADRLGWVMNPWLCTIVLCEAQGCHCRGALVRKRMTGEVSLMFDGLLRSDYPLALGFILGGLYLLVRMVRKAWRG